MGDELGHPGGGFGIGTADGEVGVDFGAGDGAEHFEVDGVCGGGGMRGRGREEVLRAYGGNEGDNLHAVGEGEIFLRYSTGSNPANCFPSATTASAAAGFDAIFLLVGVVCMAGARKHVHGAVAVILGALVFIPDDEPYGCPECDAEFGAGLDLHPVFLIAGGGEGGLAGAPAGHLGLDVGFGELHARGAAIDDASYGEAVRFAVAGRIVRTASCGRFGGGSIRCDSEVFTEGGHCAGERMLKD